jgi:hypothetical protein
MSPRVCLARRWAVAACFFCTLKCLIAQSPFVRSQAGFYVQAGWHTVPTVNTLFGDDGSDRVLSHRVGEQTCQLYGEYGINRKTTLSVVLPLRSVLVKPNEVPLPLPVTQNLVRHTRLGNTSLGIKRQLYSGWLQVTANLRIDAPAGAPKTGTALRTGYEAWTFVPSVSVGQGYRRTFWYAYGGWGYRTNNYSMFADAGVEGGVHFGPIWLIGFSQVLLSNRDGQRQDEPGYLYTGLSVDRQSWVSVGLKGIWQINRFTGLVVSAAGAPYARNVPKSPGLGVAVYFRWE